MKINKILIKLLCIILYFSFIPHAALNPLAVISVIKNAIEIQVFRKS